jgi:hypothetical protein
MKPVEQVLKDAGVRKDQIDDVSCSVSWIAACLYSCYLVSHRSSWSEVPPVFPRFNSSSRTSSTERSLPRVSTLTRPSLTVLPFRVVS